MATKPKTTVKSTKSSDQPARRTSPTATPPAFDFDDLTLREVSLIEDLSGQSIESIAEKDKPKGKSLAAIVMVIKRRTGNPKFTFNEAMDVPLAEAYELLGDDDEADPQEVEAAGEGKPSDESEPS